MRRILLSGGAALALSAGLAQAGGMAEPVMEPEVVEADAGSSAAGIVVPILLLLLIAAAASGGSDDSSGGSQPSDLRLKTDVQWMGMQDGIAVYSWRYRSRPGVWQGVMAQEVLASHPGAVVPRHDGMLAVDYTRLPVAFRRLH
jgi:hypothetical protein